MTWVFVVLLVLVLGAAVVVASGHGASMGVVHDDRRDVVVPADRPIAAADLDGVRFTTAVRGYRMDEVDDLLARLRTELAVHDRAGGGSRGHSDDPGGEHGGEHGDEHGDDPGDHHGDGHAG